jgi:glucosyl-3-phosphoglycerate synthase
MSNLYQTRAISTLHRFPAAKREKTDGNLKRFQRRQPVTLAPPTLGSEFEGPAMPRIVDALKKIRHLHQIVLAHDRADEIQFRWRASSP